MPLDKSTREALEMVAVPVVATKVANYTTSKVSGAMTDAENATLFGAQARDDFQQMFGLATLRIISVIVGLICGISTWCLLATPMADYSGWRFILSVVVGGITYFFGPLLMLMGIFIGFVWVIIKLFF